ncbi:hypothetical protein J6590_105221, partial [Homalodisca vitripennis]
YDLSTFITLCGGVRGAINERGARKEGGWRRGGGSGSPSPATDATVSDACRRAATDTPSTDRRACLSVMISSITSRASQCVRTRPSVHVRSY